LRLSETCTRDASDRLLLPITLTTSTRASIVSEPSVRTRRSGVSRRRGPLRWARGGSREGVFFPAPASRSTPLTPLSRSSPKGRALALSPSPSTNAKIASPQGLVKDLRHPQPEMPSPVRWRAPHAARCPLPDAVLLDPPCAAPWLCHQRDGPRRLFARTLPPRAAFFGGPRLHVRSRSRLRESMFG